MILRTAQGIRRGMAGLEGLAAELGVVGITDGDRAFNLTWHDRMNLHSLIQVSRAIAVAALAREYSVGAHFREDFAQTSDLAGSTYTAVRFVGDRIEVGMKPVAFTHVRPGESLVEGAGVPMATAGE